MSPRPTPARTAGAGGAASVAGASTHVRGRSSATLPGLLPLLLLLVVWEVVGSPDSPFFPAPSSWPPALGTLIERGTLVPAVVATVRTFSTALLAGTVLGAAAGALFGVSRFADRAAGPTLEFARALPPAVLVPVATLLLGYGETMKLSVVTLAALWAVLLNTRAAVRSLDPVLFDVARSLQLGPVERFTKVLLPTILPAIVLGARVAAPTAVVITLLVEILTHVNGVGALIGEAQRTFRSAQVYALIVVAGLISLAVNAALRGFESAVVRRRRPT